MTKFDDLLAELDNLGALGKEAVVEKPAPKSPPKVAPVEVQAEPAAPISEDEEALSAFTADYTLGEDTEEDAPLEEEEDAEEDEEDDEEQEGEEGEDEVAELPFDAEDVMRRLRSLLERVNGIEDEVRSLARILSEAVEPRSDSDA